MVNRPVIAVLGIAGLLPSLGFLSEDASGGAPYDVHRTVRVVVQDVMILYSTAAKEEAGGTAAMLERIDRVITDANEIYENSAVNVKLRLVHAAEVSKNPHQTDALIARRDFIDDPDPAYGDVRGLRDRYGADIVSLWGKDLDYGGVAPGMTIGHQDASLGYHIVDAELALETYSFVHEVGHNQGCYHDMETDGWADTRPSYAYGWVLDENEGLTIMAKGRGYSRIPHFSNPDVSYRGEPTGAVGLMTADSAHSYGADNARRIRETADIVAGWR